MKLLQTLISETDKVDFLKRLAGIMTLLMLLGAICTAAQGQTLSGRALIVGRYMSMQVEQDSKSEINLKK